MPLLRDLLLSAHIFRFCDVALDAITFSRKHERIEYANIFFAQETDGF